MEQQSIGLFELQLDDVALSALTETAKWNKFMAIVWFVLCGLLAIGSVFMGFYIASAAFTDTSPLSGVGGAFVSIFYLFITAIQFIPNIFRYRFSVKMLNAIRNSDQALLIESLNNLKYYSKYWGIVTIVVVSIYALGFLAIMAGLLFQLGT